MSFYYIIISWLHILATAAWIGGMAFYILVLIPSLGVLDPPQRGRLLGVKHILVLCMIALGAIVSFVIRPKLKAQATSGPPGGVPRAGQPPAVPRLQKEAGALGLLNFLLGIGLLLLTEVVRSA